MAVLVEEHVGRLEVEMEDGRLAAVQIVETKGHLATSGNPEVISGNLEASMWSSKIEEAKGHT